LGSDPPALGCTAGRRLEVAVIEATVIEARGIEDLVARLGDLDQGDRGDRDAGAAPAETLRDRLRPRSESVRAPRPRRDRPSFSLCEHIYNISIKGCGDKCD
jgi:hypothetical protein